MDIKPFENKIWLATPTMHGDEMKYVKEAYDTNWMSTVGENINEVERIAADKAEMKYAVGLSCCTAALHLAVKHAGETLYGKPAVSHGALEGKRVFCSDMTFDATLNPVVYEGGIPVFIDTEEASWNMDPVALEKAFQKYPNARVVMFAHLYGTPAKMDEILEVCRRHNAVLIEDAAEALSSTYRGQQCGTFGKYNVFSFNGNKIITTSGGGMLITADLEARNRALFLATQAREPALHYQHREIGYNYRMSNVVAGIGRGQLKHLDEHRARKERIYRRYQEGLKDLPVTMNPYLQDTMPNFWLSCMTVNEGCDVDPVDIIHRLEENNIESRPIWKPMHMQPVFEGYDFITAGDAPVNEDIYKRGMCLPSDIKMTDEEQDAVIEIIHTCFQK
jgi:dTDP-4-amino-4,6-dideoxygalactose transaminase